MNRFLEMKERGETILFSELLDDIPADDVLAELLPNASQRELKILKLRSEGLCQAEIAEKLKLTLGQVTYVSARIRKHLYGNIPSYIDVDIPPLRKVLGLREKEQTGYRLISELLRDMPSDEKLLSLFIERGNSLHDEKTPPTNRDLQLLQMRSQKRGYDSIGEEVGLSAEKVQRQISLTLIRISRDLKIKLDIPELYRSRNLSVQQDQAPVPELQPDSSEKKPNILSKRQREVWMLLEQGLNRKEIAQRLGISYSSVGAHILQAERRFLEYERYCAEEKKNFEPVFLPLTRGEVKIILAALDLYERNLESELTYRPKNDWAGRLSYEANVVANLYDKAHTLIYGEAINRIPRDWDTD